MAALRLQRRSPRSGCCSASPGMGRVRRCGTIGPQMRLVIAGGGTGGHLFPALAVARAFRAEEPRGALLLVGRSGGPEERLVPAAGFELQTVRVRGLDRDAPWKNIALPVLVPLALRSALRIVDRFRPDVVLGMGGYVMAPPVAAARMRRIPYVLHEKDVRPGLATRYFAANAAAVCTTLPGTEERLRNVRTVLTGVPLREGFEPRTPDIPPRRLPMILVPGTFGGGHQEENAAAMVAAGAALRIADEELTGESLVRAIASLDASRVRAMAKASAATGRRDAAQRVLRVLHEVVRR